MANAIDSDIRSRIDAFLAEISKMVRDSAFQAVREALGGDGQSATPARRGPGRPRGSGAKAAPARKPARAARGGKRTSEQVDAMAERLLAYVKANPGQGVEGIAKGLRVSSKELKLPVIKLLGSKSLRTTGQKRGTKYFAGGRGAGGGGKGRKAKAQRKAKGARKGRRKGASKKAGRRATKAQAQIATAIAA